MKYLSLLIGFLWGLTTWAQAQSLTVRGKVTDADNGDPIPYANVVLKGQSKGVVTDFEGNFSLPVPAGTDSITASYLGYLPRTKAVPKGKPAVLNLQLKVQGFSTEEVVILAGENPAWEVIRRVVQNKDRNNRTALPAYEYEVYSKMEVDIDNISEKFRKRRAIRQISRVMDSLETIAGEDGKPILPIFISESISQFSYKNKPEKTREEIIKTKVTGIGIDDGSLITQMVGSTFQQYNFYDNWLLILGKYFISPVADGWKLYYDYELKDSLFLGEDWCYRLEITPKRPQDLAFKGTMWIAKEDYGLKRIDVQIPNTANLNFIEKIKIQQELVRTYAGPWLPSKSRITIDVAEVANGWAGMLAKFYTSNEKFKLNNAYNESFYDNPIELREDATLPDPEYWERNRHDTLSAAEKNVIKMIDTVRNLPVVRTYIEVADIAFNGFKRVGPLDLGTYSYLYANNNIEGNRFRLGVRTNSTLSNRFTWGSYLAYGTLDRRFKYMLDLSYVINRRTWTVFGIKQQEDIDQVALLDNNVQLNTLFNAFTRFGNLDPNRPFIHRVSGTYLKTQLSKGLIQTIEFNHRNFAPLYAVGFRERPNDRNSSSYSTFATPEVTLETRYAKNEVFLYSTTNTRLRVNTIKSPVFTFRYTMGLRDFGAGEPLYHKLNLNITQTFSGGILGMSRYTFDMGYVPSTVPYPLLKSHLGNSTPVYNSLSFNLMNLFEFVSDRWVSLSWQQNLEGLVLNAIPAINRLNLRLVATGQVLWGDVSQANRDISTVAGLPAPFRSLGSDPYAEVGYGVENIFRLVRVDFIHRLTYLNNPNVSRFGVKVGVQFKL